MSSPGLSRDIVYLLAYAATGVVAIIGNFIVFKVVLTRKSMQTFVHLLLANMAFSDITCALSFFSGLLFCSDFFIEGTGSDAVCVGNKAVQLLSFQVKLTWLIQANGNLIYIYKVSSVTMVVVAVDRAIAVFFPFYHIHRDSRAFSNNATNASSNWNRIVRMVIGVWLIAIALIIFTSPALGYQRYHFSPNEGQSLISCEIAAAFDVFGVGNSASRQRVLLIVANLTHFWIPFGIIGVVYGAIGVRVWKRKLDFESQSQSDALLMQRWKTIKMLIAAVVVFVSCWLPFFIFNVVNFISDSEKKRPCNQSIPYLVVIWMAFSSCCYNPLVYWIYNEEYRKGILSCVSLFVCSVGGGGRGRSSTSSTTPIKQTIPTIYQHRNCQQNPRH